MRMDDKVHYDEATAEALRHLEDSEVSKLGHWHAVGIYEARHRWLIALPAIVASVLLTWLLTSSLDSLFGG
jgi:hypothetical protein